MENFFFGNQDKQIFASISHPKSNNRNTCALLFYPFGQEYMRAHKAYRQLATLLSRRGITTMRFDYPGSGDSYGAGETICFNDWLNSGQDALKELVSRTNASKVHLVGLRLGSLVAASIAQQNKVAHKLILWDPFIDGKSCIDDSKKQLRQLEDTSGGIWNLHGYPMNNQFREQVKKINLPKKLLNHNLEIHQIVSHEFTDSKKIREELGPEIKHAIVPPENNWNYVDMEGSILMPTPIIKTIVTTLSIH